ncbi:MAG: endonuclease III [Treponema sp.]|nr:endonuclease III [Clostridia bacterium]MBP3607688.1 endonuclease III [Treponema sp.]
MTKNELIIQELSKCYDGEKGSLDFTTPFELLVAVMLSAQCTDARVNIVTKDLFKVCNTPEGFSKMDVKEIEKLISSISFYRNKAKHIKECSIQLINKYNGIVPQSMEELTTLAGIGRKSANVIMLEAFNNCQGIAVDTHALRLSNRLGFSKETDPTKVELDLLKKFPKKYWRLMNHLLVYHGRAICKAQKPLCSDCSISTHCKYYKKQNKVKKDI